MNEADPNQRDDVPFPTQFGGRNPMAYGPPQQQQVQPQQPVHPLQQAANLLQQAGYQVVPQAAAPESQNGQAMQHYQPERSSPEMESSVAKQRLATLKMGFACGLADVCDFMLDGIASYQQQYQQATGQPLEFEEALSHVMSAMSCITT